MFLKTKEDDKESWVGADVAIERLRCAEGAHGAGRGDVERVPSGHRRPHTSGVCANPRVKIIGGTKPECI